jgi:membrane fusion protein (multidrug efflux system)
MSRRTACGRLVAAGLMAAGLQAALAAAPVAPPPAPAAASSRPAALAPVPAAPAADTALTDKDGRVRVQFVARNEVVVASELSAKIANLPWREGDAFRAGQQLVGFDCSLYVARRNKAQATLDAARQTLSVSKRLNELNSIGALEVQQAEAKVKEDAAELAYMQATVSKCSIAAPFSGRVAKRMAAAHQYVEPGTPLLGILDTGVLEVQMILPSRWLAWLKPGLRFTVQVDELGKSATGQVVRLGARIDPVSQSVAVTGVIEGGSGQLLPGMSGWASFQNAK